MATKGRRPDPPLEQTLFEEPYRFNFFQAVRLLAQLDPRRVPVGREGHPHQESVRFRAHVSFAFPPSEVVALTRAPAPSGAEAAAAAEAEVAGDRRPDLAGPPEMTVAFMGLVGPSAVLPHAYTELLLERRKARDGSLAAFLDLFHHRLIALFYRAWEKHRVYVPFERGAGDGLGQHLFDLIGLGLPALRDRQGFPDRALLYYTGTLARRQRPALMLGAMLREYFGLPIEVEQFQGHWLRLDQADRSRMGASGAHNGLGTSLVLGGRVWDEQGKIRLRVGPLGFDDFLALLPDGPAHRPLAELTRLYVDAEFAFDVQLILKAEEIPPCRLGGGGARLGRHAWLISRPPVRDADDAVFDAGA